MMKTEIVLPFKKMSLLPSLSHLGKIEKIVTHARGLKIQVKLEKFHYEKLKRLLK